MKKSYFIILIFLAFGTISCSKGQKRYEKPESVGNVNAISLIINDVLWNGEVGDSLRKKFAQPVLGLTQEEPIFTINQYPMKGMDGYKNQNRNLIVVKKESAHFEIVKNEFAQPQNIFYISGNSIPEIIGQIEKNADSVIKVINQTEIAYKQSVFKKSPLSDHRIRRKFRISLLAPSDYKCVMRTKSFMWLKKEILSGNTSLLIYKVPLKDVLKNGDYVSNVIRIRDSVGARYIHGKVKNTRMITEASYSPYFQKTVINGKTAFETKGNWEMLGDFMSGPFINYAIIDRKRGRCIILEGFCYAPSNEKRDLMHELKSIIQSAKVLSRRNLKAK